MYANWYCNYFKKQNTKDQIKLYFAIAFHDIVRQGELEDVWEHQSYETNCAYLNNIKIDKKIVKASKELIIDKNKNQ
jgi:hypothetical protein